MAFSVEQLTSLMIDVGWICVLLLAGKLIRAKVVVFQKIFLPASIIGGFIGLALGPYVLGAAGMELIPLETLSTWGSLPGVLISIVFACLFLGIKIPSIRTIWLEGGPQFCYGWIAGMGQYMVGVGIAVLLLGPLFGVPPIFGCILEIGFSGGHGTAAGMKEAFSQLNFPAGSELGLMSATVGIFVAVVLGMILINYAVRKGYTTVITSPEKLPEESIRGLIPKDKRQTGSFMTVSPDAVEPFAFHGAFVGVAVLLGWFMLKTIKSLSAGMEPDLFRSFPLFPLAMLGGLIVQVIASRTGIAKYFDRKTFDRILGTALDILVVSAIASIKLDVFLAYFWPFLILMAAGISWLLFCTLVIAPRMLPDVWFERAITEYGMQTGVTAMGLLLLRVADPNFKTPAAKSFGFKQIIYEPFMGGGFITASSPILLVSFGVGLPYIIGLGSILLVLVIAWLSGWLHRFNSNQSRNQEA
ncbi:MAG: sodium/glutamate symporter [Acidobacteriota bacterium]